VDGWGVEVGLFKRGGEEERSGGCDGVIFYYGSRKICLFLVLEEESAVGI
jgi:hypothetical protein